MTNLDMLNMFEAVSVLFRASYQEPLWGKYCSHLGNTIDAVCIFFRGYAFEHQGRSPSYPPAAVKAVKQRTPLQAAGHVRAVCRHSKSNKFICLYASFSSGDP